jgi:hypothetical protein
VTDDRQQLFRKPTSEDLLRSGAKSASAVTDARAALEVPERTRPRTRGRLGFGVLLAAVLALVAEALGFRFFNNLADRIGASVVALLLASIVLAAIALERRQKGRSINEQSLEQAERNGLLAIEPEAGGEIDLAARISPLMLWAAILFDVLGLLLLLDGAVVAGVILFVASSVFLSLWMRVRPDQMRSPR